MKHALLAILITLALTAQAYALTIVRLGPEYFPDKDRSKAISSGFIYVGEPSTDPSVPANQKTLRVQQENGTIVAVTQPIRTNAGGVPVYQGSPVTLLVDGNYSLLVQNKQQVQEYYVPSIDGGPVTSNLSGYGCNFAAAVSQIGPTVTHLIVDCSPDDLSANLTIPSNITIEWRNGFPLGGAFTLTVNGAFIAGRYKLFDTNTILAGNPKFDAIYPEWFGVTGDGTTDDTAAIQKAFNFLKSTGGAILFEPSRYAVTDQLEIELINGASIIGANRGEQGVIFDYNNATTEAFLALYGVNNFDIINISVDCNGNRGILFGDKDPSSLTYRSGNTLFENVSITSTSKGISFQVPGGYNRFKRVNMTVNANGQAVDIGKSLTNTVLLANYIFFDDCSFISGNSNTIAFDLNAIQYMQINKVDMARFTKGINIENTREVSNIIVSGNYFFNNSNASTSVYIQTGAIFRNLTLRDNNHLHTNGTFINIQSGTNRVNDMLIDGDFCQGTYTNGYILNDVELKLTDIKVFAGVTFDDKSTIGSNVNIDYQNLKPPPQYEQNVVPAAGRAYDFNQDALPEKVPMGVVESVESSSGDEVPVRFTQAYIGDGTTLRITVTNTHSANADFTVWIP